MIKCPKCDADNMIGAIFCRGCGQKLDIDQLTPDQVSKAAEPIKKRGSGIVNLIGLVVVLAVVAVGVLAFLPPAGMTARNSLGENDMKTAQGKAGRFVNGKTGNFMEFNADEVTSLVRFQVGLTGEKVDELKKAMVEQGQSTYLMPQSIDVQVDSDTAVTVYLRYKFFDMLDVYFTGKYDVSAGATGLSLSPTSATIGRLPAVAALNDTIFSKFSAVMASAPGKDKLTKMAEVIAKVSVTGDKVTVSHK